MLSYSDILEIKNQYVLLQKIPRRSLFLLFFFSLQVKRYVVIRFILYASFNFYEGRRYFWYDILIYA